MTQMAAMSFTRHLRTTHLNNSKCSKFPIQQLAIPLQHAFPQAAFNGGRRGGRCHGRGRGGRGRTPFADHLRMTGGSPALQGSVFPLQ